MPHYRIYSLDAAGRIVSGHDALCMDDQEARRTALGLLEAGRDGEIWNGRRRVGRVDHATPWAHGHRGGSVTPEAQAGCGMPVSAGA